MERNTRPKVGDFIIKTKGEKKNGKETDKRERYAVEVVSTKSEQKTKTIERLTTGHQPQGRLETQAVKQKWIPHCEKCGNVKRNKIKKMQQNKCYKVNKMQQTICCNTTSLPP